MGTGFALGLLVAICGFIAYSGDLLGRRLGKRRLTLWGLRPRHTAVVFTVVTGMVIALLSLGAMVGLSAGVRRAVLYGEGLLHENWRLRQANRQAQELSETLRYRNYRQVERLTEQDRANRDLDGKNRELRRRQRELSIVLQKREVLNARLEQDRQRLEARIAQLEQNRLGLDARNRSLARRVSETRQRFNEAHRQVVVARRELENTRGMLSRAQVEIARAFQDFSRVREQRDEQRDKALALAGQRLIARTDEELARVVLPEGSSYSGIQEVLESLLQRAQNEVVRRQRAAHASPPAAPIVLVPRWAERGKVIEVVVEGTRRDLIRADGGARVLRVVVDENTAPGRPVPVRILRAANSLAFRKGEEIARIDLDGAEREGAILRTLLGFLQQTVRSRALTRGVIPGTDGRVGEIQYDPLLDTVKKVRDIAGPARIGVVAAEDVWSAGPLQVDFYVLPGEQRVAGDR